MNISSHINRLYIFIYICWLPLQLLVLKSEGLGFIPIILCYIAILSNIVLNRVSLRHILFNKYMFFWIALIAFMFFNWEAKSLIMFESYSKRLSFIASSFIMPTTLIVAYLSEYRVNHSATLKLLFVTLFVYCCLGVLNLAAGQDNLEGRMFAEGIGNDLPLHAFLLFCVILYMKRLELVNTKVLIGTIMLVLLIITVSATRKAFGACVIVGFGYFLTNNKDGISIKNIVLLIVSFIAFYYVFEYSGMAERLASSSENYDHVRLVNNSFLNSLLIKATGDRAIQYSLCFELIPDSFLTGIGLRNFMAVTGFINPLHTEYMVQLCENGIVGFTLLILFYYTICKGLIRRRKKGDTESVFLLFMLISILFLNFTTWNYDSHLAMVIYSFCIYNLSFENYQL